MHGLLEQRKRKLILTFEKISLLYKYCKKTSNIYVCEMYYNILYCGRDCRKKSVELPSVDGAKKQKTVNHLDS